MSYKLVITRYQSGIISILYDEMQKPVEMQFTHKDHASLAGNIYVGRVKDVVKQVKGAFLDLGDGLKAYYPTDDNAAPFYTKKGSSKDIQQGDELLVQIKKDAVKTKDPAVTSEISISSVYFVAFLNHGEVHFSGKMGKEAKERIRRLLASLNPSENDEGVSFSKSDEIAQTSICSDSIVHNKTEVLKKTDIDESSTRPAYPFGLIVRTNAEGASDEELIADLKLLTNRLQRIKDIAKYRPGASCIYQKPAAYLNMIQNTNQELLSEVITDDKDLLEEIQNYVLEYQPALKAQIRFYQDKLLPLDKLYSIDTHVSDAFQERIWLKSGAYLVLQETEALTVVDVNSGKFTAKKSKEETFLKINLEAAEEITRQLRLRNISGIIVVDFINMKAKEAQEQLLSHFQRCLSADPQKATVIDMTPLGLVEVTRQRTLGTIREQMRNRTSPE